jgi:hypothetical protein
MTQIIPENHNKIQNSPTFDANAKGLTKLNLKNRYFRIKFIRSVFFGAIFATSILFIGVLVFNSLKPKNELNGNFIKGDKLVIDKPTFIGHSLDSGKIIVTAEEANRPLAASQSIIELKLPFVTTQSGAKLKAKTGTWDEAKQELTLNGNVEVEYSNGDKAYSQDAYYGRVANPNNKGYMFSDPIVYLANNVKLLRKSGENIETNMGIWNDKTQMANFGNNNEMILPLLKPLQQDFVRINFANGFVTSKSMNVLPNEKIIRGSGSATVNFKEITASADSYEFHSDTKRIILRGNARAIFSQ